MKIYGFLLLIFVLGIVSGCTQSSSAVNAPVQNEQTQNNEQTTTPPPLENTPVEATPSGISLSELSAHNDRADCWVAYKGKVYDITKFVPVHPGGASKIIPYCGTASEFENKFTKQHGTSQVSRLLKEGQYMGDLQ